MKAVLDACVLFPTVMREVLLAVADEGLYRPVWSARIMEEWLRASRRLGAAAEVQARGEAAVMTARFPKAELPPAPGLEARLYLPDPADIHVLAVAIAGSCDVIVTLNAADFPRHTLREEGLDRADPDSFLCALHDRDPVAVTRAATRVLDEARRLSGEDWQMRALLKKAQLPRLGKRLTA